MKKVFSLVAVALLFVSVMFTSCRDNASTGSATEATETAPAPAEAAPATETAPSQAVPADTTGAAQQAQ